MLWQKNPLVQVCVPACFGEAISLESRGQQLTLATSQPVALRLDSTSEGSELALGFAPSAEQSWRCALDFALR